VGHCQPAGLRAGSTPQRVRDVPGPGPGRGGRADAVYSPDALVVMSSDPRCELVWRRGRDESNRVRFLSDDRDCSRSDSRPAGSVRQARHRGNPRSSRPCARPARGARHRCGAVCAVRPHPGPGLRRHALRGLARGARNGSRHRRLRRGTVSHRRVVAARRDPRAGGGRARRRRRARRGSARYSRCCRPGAGSRRRPHPRLGRRRLRERAPLRARIASGNRRSSRAKRLGASRACPPSRCRTRRGPAVEDRGRDCHRRCGPSSRAGATGEVSSSQSYRGDRATESPLRLQLPRSQ
jgi:hypothetical protein